MAKVSKVLVSSVMVVALVVCCGGSALDNLPTTTEESEGFKKEVKADNKEAGGIIRDSVNKAKDLAYETYKYGEGKATGMKNAAEEMIREVGAEVRERASEMAKAAKQKLSSTTEAAKQKANQAREAARFIKVMGMDATEDFRRKQSEYDLETDGSFAFGKQAEIGFMIFY